MDSNLLRIEIQYIRTVGSNDDTNIDYESMPTMNDRQHCS